MGRLRNAVMKRTHDATVALSPLGDFVDSLVQSLEDRRAGLKDDALSAEDAERFFGELYEREQARLREVVSVVDPQLAPARREALCAEVDELARRVLLPAYARLAAAFTARERNDFFQIRGA